MNNMRGDIDGKVKLTIPDLNALLSSLDIALNSPNLDDDEADLAMAMFPKFKAVLEELERTAK